MNAAAMVDPTGDSERGLLARLDDLLTREETMIVARDASGIAAVAEEREHLAARLAKAARTRRLATTTDADAELVELYAGLRQRHAVRAEVLHRHAQRNAQALGVLAQASGRQDTYGADGRVRLQFA